MIQVIQNELKLLQPPNVLLMKLLIFSKSVFAMKVQYLRFPIVLSFQSHQFLVEFQTDKNEMKLFFVLLAIIAMFCGIEAAPTYSERLARDLEATCLTCKNCPVGYVFSPSKGKCVKSSG
jgi:hypothetical protein